MKTVSFYMRGGHVIQFGGVESAEVYRNQDGTFSGYTINWKDGAKPSLLSLSIPHIVAVVVT